MWLELCVVNSNNIRVQLTTSLFSKWTLIKKHSFWNDLESRDWQRELYFYDCRKFSFQWHGIVNDISFRVIFPFLLKRMWFPALKMAVVSNPGFSDQPQHWNHLPNTVLVFFSPKHFWEWCHTSAQSLAHDCKFASVPGRASTICVFLYRKVKLWFQTESLAQWNFQNIEGPEVWSWAYVADVSGKVHKFVSNLKMFLSNFCSVSKIQANEPNCTS